MQNVEIAFSLDTMESVIVLSVRLCARKCSQERDTLNLLEYITGCAMCPCKTTFDVDYVISFDDDFSVHLTFFLDGSHRKSIRQFVHQILLCK